MRTYPQQAANLIIQYVKPAVEKHGVPLEEFEPSLLAVLAHGVTTGMITVRMFRDFIDTVSERFKSGLPSMKLK